MLPWELFRSIFRFGHMAALPHPDRDIRADSWTDFMQQPYSANHSIFECQRRVPLGDIVPINVHVDGVKIYLGSAYGSELSLLGSAYGLARGKHCKFFIGQLLL